jgi:hypothetical protein
MKGIHTLIVLTLILPDFTGLGYAAAPLTSEAGESIITERTKLANENRSALDFYKI